MLSSEPGQGANPSVPLPTEEQIEQFESECRAHYLMSVNASTYAALSSNFNTAREDDKQQAANGLMPMDGVHAAIGICWAILLAAPVWSAALALGYWLWK